MVRESGANSSATDGGLGLILLAAIALGLLFSLGTPEGADEPLVVYCAHDAVFSEDILRAWSRESGIPISIRFDTEATKSLGLVNQILAERQAPRCDVFWNNELLGALQLQQAGLTEPYRGTGWSRIPAEQKDPEGHWTGFAARARVVIYSVDQSRPVIAPLDEPWPSPVPDPFRESDASSPPLNFAIARPLYGTTLTHYSLLAREWGLPRLKARHAEAVQRGMKLVAGNAAVKDVVAARQSAAGWTDTDDFFAAHDAGRAVAMSPVRLENGQTIVIPNTAMIIRGTRQLARAQQLVDALLSARTELALARSPSRQIPLGPVDAAELPSDVAAMSKWVTSAAPLRDLLPQRLDVIDWLKSPGSF